LFGLFDVDYHGFSVVPSHRREDLYAKDYYANPMSDQLLYSFPERLKDAGM
jgi:hypothetical protein